MSPFSTYYKDALKFGFYELQTARDWYREVTADVGMHAGLVERWIRTAALLITPIAPHFAEHIWMSPEILAQKTTIQNALWPTPSAPVERSIIESGIYMRGLVKTMRDSETQLVKRLQKAKGKGKEAAYDPKKPRAVNIYVASAFPEWQDTCVAAVQAAYDEAAGTINDVKVREILTEKGLIKDKRAMPFVQTFKVSRFQELDKTVYRADALFSETLDRIRR